MTQHDNRQTASSPCALCTIDDTVHCSVATLTHDNARQRTTTHNHTDVRDHDITRGGTCNTSSSVNTTCADISTHLLTHQRRRERHKWGRAWITLPTTLNSNGTAGARAHHTTITPAATLPIHMKCARRVDHIFIGRCGCRHDTSHIEHSSPKQERPALHDIPACA